jgi:tetratricopeptide (TPR) repeat protein
MRTLALALVSLLLLVPAVGQAQERAREPAAGGPAQSDARARRDAAARLGEVGTMADMPALAKALRDPDEGTRENAEQAMWQIWARSGNADVDRLYRKGVEQMSAGDLDEAIATFSRIIAQKPEFAEGWNKRATLYYLTGDMRKSLADCDEVIKRNPWHFGALSGYALIYMRTERYERALDYSRRALEVNPNLDSVRDNVRQLERLLEQQRGKSI